ncbi:transposase [Paraburkholderia youngii]|uniref:transposase n=1 Tax=Paraburkholderia youngii TaxID=2782701 RepID=UPI003D1E737E
MRSFNRPRHTKFLTPPEETKKGFVLLPRRWVVERSFGWLNRFRRLARDYERLPETLAGLHFVVFAMLMLVHAVPVLQSS